MVPDSPLQDFRKDQDEADSRLGLLHQWLQSLPQLTNGYELEPLYDDASFRRYFRARAGDGSWVVMDAPPDREPIDDFIRIDSRFHGMGLNVPEIIAFDERQGFILLSDLGDRQLLDLMNDDNIDSIHSMALAPLVTLQAGVLTDPEFLPAYDRKLLLGEMHLFRDWYLARHLQAALDKNAQTLLSNTFDQLANNALEQPQVWVHRDYHSRNLMQTGTNPPGILDFQDAVTGPITYDAVSLLRDCYIAWPRAYIENRALGFYEQLMHSGLLKEDVSEQTFMRWFDLMGVQRHLKAIGIFSRLNYRDGKQKYLDDIPRTWNYVVEAAEKHPRLQTLVALTEKYQT
ncbi:MAG: aminoglycoside phosphotransferase [Gammaproteobacteria bacterium]|nr:MAG: aminoglycoside phosphotransferase [Gammaproteobacteria bacterium]